MPDLQEGSRDNHLSMVLISHFTASSTPQQEASLRRRPASDNAVKVRREKSGGESSIYQHVW